MEFPGYYEIEMPAPGFQKDDFIVKTQGCSLLIIGYKKCSNNNLEARYHHHDFRYQYLTRNIDLPSGTSGMAAAMNGAINVSTPNGWFPEFAKDKVNSFVVPPAPPNLSDHEQDAIEANNLYDLLEKEIHNL